MFTSIYASGRGWRSARRMTLAIALPLLLAGCLFIPVAHQKPVSPTFVGTVRDVKTGRPIADAQVKVTAGSGTDRTPVESSTRTGADGGFRLVATRASRWFYVVPLLEGTCASDISAAAEGYAPITRSIRVWSNGAVNGLCRGVIEQIELPLEPIPHGDANTK